MTSPKLPPGWNRKVSMVDHVARGRHWIRFSGTADQAARTFHTRFHRYRVNGETHFANVDEPSVPAALAGVAGGFLGLDDFKLRSILLIISEHMISVPARRFVQVSAVHGR